MLSLQEKIEIVIIYHDALTNREVADIFNARHPEKPPISHTTVSRLLRKFRETGTVANNFKKTHKKWKTGKEENELNVCLEVVEHGQTSLSKVAKNTNVSIMSVSRILKRNRFRPYKPKFISTLKERDFVPRFAFSAWYQGEVEENPFFPSRILWTDEATFSSNGVVSSQNCRWWAQENPNFVIECRDQYSFKINVWCGLMNNKIIGPFFFRENLTSQRYLQFLENELSDALDEINLRDLQLLWYQQDGATVHSTMPVRQFLDRKFGGKWLGRYSEYPWPPRSPDLTPLDFFCGVI